MEFVDTLPATGLRNLEFDAEVAEAVTTLKQNPGKYGLLFETEHERERNSVINAYRLRLQCGEDQVTVHQRQRLVDGKTMYGVWGLAKKV